MNREALEAAIRKLPQFDLTWDAERQDTWMRWVGILFAAIKGEPDPGFCFGAGI